MGERTGQAARTARTALANLLEPAGRLVRAAAFAAVATGALAAAISPATLAGDGLVNWESPHVHPLDLTPDGRRLLAVNTAAATLEVFDVSDAGLAWVGSIPVGLDPVGLVPPG